MHAKQLLDRHGIEAKKSLGQNFLDDENVLRRLIDAADLTAADQVLEIGPGVGSLTRLLAEAAARVVAVELDDRLLPILREELAPYDNVTLIHGDILAQDPADLFAEPYKVVANVPYYITGAILRHLLEAAHKPALLVLTVQKEVAERIVATPPDMSLLAVSVQYYGRAAVVATIKAGAFWPRPDVDSAVVRVDLTQGQRVDDEQRFFRIVKAGFSQKRKQLQKNLRQLGLEKTAVRRALIAAGVDGRRRAETVTLPEWRAIYEALETVR